MNDFASTINSDGLLKNSYDDRDSLLDALRRRQETMAAKVKARSADPQQDKGQDE
jgi:hypothetical protein